MGKVYLIAHSESFTSDTYQIPIQNDLLKLEGEPITSIGLNEEDFYEGLDQFKCHHDYRHNKKGRVFDQNFNYYFEPVDFHTYFCKESNLTLIQTSTDIALDYINKLNSSKYFKIEPVTMKFELMIPYIEEIKGAWISELKKAHLKTAGYFGPHVNKSEEYIEAAEEGNVSSIVIKFISDTDGIEYTVTISNKGSIFIANNLDNIKDELDLVFEIYNKLIRPHV